MKILWKRSGTTKTTFCTSQRGYRRGYRADSECKGAFRRIAETNWDYAEPGALFWDRIEGWNLLSNTKQFSYAGVNPCAEEPLPAGGSCLLGSINLSEFVQDPFTDHAQFDFEGLKHCVDVSVRALNEVLEEGLPLHPLKEQQERGTVEADRTRNHGTCGLSDQTRPDLRGRGCS